VPQKADTRGVAGDSARSYDDGRDVLLDGLAQLPLALETVHLLAHPIAGVDISRRRRAHTPVANWPVRRRPMHEQQWFADLEAQLRVQGERAQVAG
jgi:hypothetical protein